MSRVKVYLAGPISGDAGRNVAEATRVAAHLIDQGYSVLCPQLTCFMCYHEYYPHLPDIEPEPDACDFTHEQWIANDLPWIESADVVLRLAGESKGADLEVAHAEAHGVPVVYTIDDLPDPKGCDAEEVVETPWRYFREDCNMNVIRVRGGALARRYFWDGTHDFDCH